MQCSSSSSNSGSSFFRSPSLTAYPLCLPECLPGLVTHQCTERREKYLMARRLGCTCTRLGMPQAGRDFSLLSPSHSLLSHWLLAALSSHASWPHATCHLRRRTSSAAVMPLAALISHSSRHSKLTWPGKARQGEARQSKGELKRAPAHFLGATISSCRVP